MEPEGSNSKRKRTEATTSSNWLHPGQWRGNKKPRSVSGSRSPSPSGVSTPSEASTNEPTQLNRESQSPAGQSSRSSTNRRAEPSQATARAPTGTTAGTPTPNSNQATTAWSGLEKALRALRITTDICPSLSTAIDGLTSCLRIFEEAAKNRQDYDDLATGLKSIVEMLIKHLRATHSEDLFDGISSISEAITKEIKSIETRHSSSGLRWVLGPGGDDEDLIRRYRRIEQLFRQLQGEASMSTWNITSKHFINTQLKSLNPARLARFDSGLSTEIGRRTCTENTRTQILHESMQWSEDPNAAKIYWMNGMAGTGKTTIACSLCESLNASKQLAASFFCTRTSPECREAKRIVPTIAYQLARHSTPFRSALCKALEDDPDIDAGNISSQFDLLLKRPLLKIKEKLPDNLVVVVDALDECNDPHIVELFLSLLFQSITDLPIKFYVTSRPEPAIRNRMMSESERLRSILYLHEIEQSLVQADIGLYLKEELAFVSPSDSDIEELAEHAGNLFIYAATAVRYIRPIGKSVDSSARLAAVLAVDTKSKKLSGIDALYSAILSAVIDDGELEPEESHRIQLVLWTAICACEPILITTISALCGLDDTNSTITALQPLRSVLHVSDHSELVTTLHASFPDYMFDQERSGVFFCDRDTHSMLLAQQCFQIMQSQLRFNICSIQSSFVPDDEIDELENQVITNISEELFYTCRFWMDHLSQTGSIETLIPQLHGFLSKQLLFWMEVLNLKKRLGTGVVIISKLNSCLVQVKHADAYPDLSQLASDAYSFVAGYISSHASAYTPHIYLSALPLCSPSSQMRLYYLPRFRGLVKVSGEFMDCLQQASLSTWESTHPLRSASFSPGGNLVLGSDTGKISVQNAHDGKYVLQPFKAHKKPITSIGISSDDMKIVSGSNDKTLCVWSMQDGILIAGPFNGHTNRVTSTSFSPDGSQIVSGSDDCVVGIWNSQNAGIPMRSLAGHTKAVKSVAFSPDGTRVVSGSLDHTIRVWELSSGVSTLILKRHNGSVTSVQYSPDGAHIISGSNDGNICIWDASDGTLCGHPLQGHKRHITSIAVSPEGERIASGSLDCTVRVWDKRTGKLIGGPLTGHSRSVRSVSFSDDGMRIVSASDDKTVRVWNLPKVQQAMEPPKPTEFSLRLLNFAFSSDRKRVAMLYIALYERNIDIWDMQKGALLVSIPAEPIYTIRSMQLSLDGTRIFTSLTSGELCTWSISQAKLIDGPRVCSINRPGDPPLSVKCSADGTRVVTCFAEGVELWDVQSHRSVAYSRTGVEHDRLHTPRIIFSQQGGRFVTVFVQSRSGDFPSRPIYITHVWDTESGNCIAGPYTVAQELDFSPDGTNILCADYGVLTRLKTIDVDSGVITQMPEIQDETIHVWSGKFSPDSLHVSVHTPAGIYVWNIHDQKIITIRSKVIGSLASFAYSTDGWCLASGTPCYTPNEYARVFQVWRFHIDRRFCATIQSDGWLVDAESQLLFWVPTEIRNKFPKGSGFVIRRDGGLFASVDYSDLLIGEAWSKCYIND